jgi:hypothetical protein
MDNAEQVTGADVARKVIELVDAGLVAQRSVYLCPLKGVESCANVPSLPPHQCKACVLGAFVLAGIKLGVVPEAVWTSQTAGTDILAYDYLPIPRADLERMERSFELWDRRPDDVAPTRAGGVVSWERTADIFARQPDWRTAMTNAERMRLIAENVVANGGRYKPPAPKGRV